MHGMKRYCLSFADSLTHVPDNPERTAKHSGHGMDMNVYYQVWSNRAAMLKTIDLQSRRTPHPSDWRACKIPAREVA